jgi:nucleoid-associated protein YgaU
MYREAKAADFSFFETSASVRRAVNAGILVRLPANDADFDLHEVGYPYVRPATLTFVNRLGAQYADACGETLVVTSAVRPETRQPANSTERSVHPTGMAVDLRKSESARCLRWLRSALLDLERDGLIEATEEHHPAHFHVAVFPSQYTRYVAARQSTVTLATYVVRRGDTLSEIAHEHDVTVKALIRANGLDDNTILPGQELRIPNG